MKERKKRSAIWKAMADDEFREMVKNSKTYGEMLRHFNLVNKGGNHKTLRRRIEKLNIDDSHIPKGMGSNQGRSFPSKEKIPLEKMLIENSPHSRNNLKRRLIKEKLLKAKCYVCGSEPFWNNKPLTLSLDHLNGIRNDNRIENLRLLCPNCHSQTSTFAGRKLKKKHLCPNCGGKMHRISKLCSFCKSLKYRRCTHPTKDVLEELIKNKSIESIGREYGVCGASVKKWAISYGIFQHRKFKHRKIDEQTTVPAVGVEPTCTN